MTAAADLGSLGLGRGGHLLLRRALSALSPGERLEVVGSDVDLRLHLPPWCRREGHQLELAPAGAAGPVATITCGGAQAGRWQGATRAGRIDRTKEDGVVERPPARWGLAARGATVEAGGPVFVFGLADKDELWADEAARLYQQAAAAQWDPERAIDWQVDFQLPEEVEDAVVQVMTYLIENETVALLVPARFLSQIHPHFREVMQLLAIQVADEARHIEVFTRRAALRRDALGLSSAGGQASLKTLFDEPDFALASFLLSVLGEGSFLVLLRFLHEHAPDPITRQIATLAAQDEARHVAYGLAHLERHARIDPTMHVRLSDAVHRRHDALRDTAGLNDLVFDALLLMAAGSFAPSDVAAGYDRVEALLAEMDRSRRRHLVRLGFAEEQAAALSSLHTRNFM